MIENIETIKEIIKNKLNKDNLEICLLLLPEAYRAEICDLIMNLRYDLYYDALKVFHKTLNLRKL